MYNVVANSLNIHDRRKLLHVLSYFYLQRRTKTLARRKRCFSHFNFTPSHPTMDYERQVQSQTVRKHLVYRLDEYQRTALIVHHVVFKWLMIGAGSPQLGLQFFAMRQSIFPCTWIYNLYEQALQMVWMEVCRYNKCFCCTNNSAIYSTLQS